MKRGFLKKLTALTLALVTVASLAGCSNQVKGECSMCGKKAKLYEFTQTSDAIIGYNESKTVDVCEDCLHQLIQQAESYEPSMFGEQVTYSYKEKTKD